jgi:hypothetical protein
MYPNFEPEVRPFVQSSCKLTPALQFEIRVGDFGTIDPRNGAFEHTGNIYDLVVDQNTLVQSANPPLPQPIQSNPSGLCQIVTTEVTASSSEIST